MSTLFLLQSHIKTLELWDSCHLTASPAPPLHFAIYWPSNHQPTHMPLHPQPHSLLSPQFCCHSRCDISNYMYNAPTSIASCDTYPHPTSATSSSGYIQYWVISWNHSTFGILHPILTTTPHRQDGTVWKA